MNVGRVCSTLNPVSISQSPVRVETTVECRVYVSFCQTDHRSSLKALDQSSRVILLQRMVFDSQKFGTQPAP